MATENKEHPMMKESWMHYCAGCHCLKDSPDSIERVISGSPLNPVQVPLCKECRDRRDERAAASRA